MAAQKSIMWPLSTTIQAQAYLLTTKHNLADCTKMETIQKRVLVLLLSLLMYPLGMPNRGDGQELKRIDHQSMKAILSHELLS